LLVVELKYVCVCTRGLLEGRAQPRNQLVSAAVGYAAGGVLERICH
jgi:hypothetical protein